METKVNYTVVGFFVTFSLMVMIIIAFWLSVGLSNKTYNNYVVYINESVSGLSLKAPVKFNGVDVGYVTEIKIRASNPQQVYLLLSIEEGTPISQSTVAQLSSQGLTGIAYLELDGGKADSLALTAKPGEEYPVIQSRPSLFTRLDTTIEHMSQSFDKFSVGLGAILTQQNGEKFTQILNNLASVSKVLSENSDSLNHLIRDTQSVMANTAVASKKFSSVLDNINASAQSVDEFAASWQSVGGTAQETLNNTTAVMQGLNDQFLPDFVETLSEIRSAVRSLESITTEIEQNPAVIIRGKTQSQLGPGE